MHTSDDMDNFSFFRIPIIPLPGPGDGGQAYPGTGFPGDNIPIAPLPGPGEGGPVYPGDNIPIAPLPGPGEGGPVYPGDNIPITPLPGPGDGGQAHPGPGRYCKVRFLNAAFGYPSLRVFVGNRTFANALPYTARTLYGRVPDGFRTVTVAASDGGIFLQKSMPFKTNDILTVAIINTASGMDLIQISDIPCTRPSNRACIRVCALAYNCDPVDVMLTDGRVVYSDVYFKETTAFKQIRPGTYEFYLARTPMINPRSEDIETLESGIAAPFSPEVLVSFIVKATRGASITVYILTRDNIPNAIQVLVVEDR